MNELIYVKLYLNYRDAVEPLSDAERGRLFMALLDYAKLGTEPQLNGNERFLFPMMRAQFERDIKEFDEISDERSKAGKKGAEAKKAKQANAEFAKQNKQMPDLLSKTSKDKDKDKNKDKDTIPPVSPLSGGPELAFGDDLNAAVDEWLRYKQERHESYKPTGHKLLLSQIANKAKEYGEDAVAEVIRTSISSGYKGIVFDRLARPSYGRASPKQADRGTEMDELVAEFMRE